MKKLFSLVMAAILFLAGCGGRAQTIINLAGSTSVQPLAELLAETYMKNYPGITINVQGGGSSAGIEAVTEGVVEIGMSSRPLKEDEKLLPYTIAFDAVAVIVHPASQLNGLKISELKKIYSGETKKWSEVFPGGDNREIDVVTREEGSGTRDAFAKIVMGEAGEITPTAIVQDATGVVREIVASDEAAIGYISLGIADQRVKVLKIDGVLPSFATVKNNQYRITRPFLFVLKKAPAGEVKKFLDYLVSPAAQKIVKESGFVPVI